MPKELSRRRFRAGVLSVVILASLSLAAFEVRAEIEKTGYPSDRGIEFMWWPKVTVPDGWIHEHDVSLANAINMMVLKGETFAGSPVLMYARALYFEAGDTEKELAASIVADHEGFLEKFPNSKITQVAATETGDGTKLQTFAFTPDGAGNWELVAYGREPKYVLMFCISARSQEALEKHRAAFYAMVRSYTSKE